MRSLRYCFFVAMALCLTACNKGPKPIVYGKEECAFCKMTIMDKRFGCQVMNTKGKAWSFDDLVCLAGFQKSGIVPLAEVGGTYVADFLGDNALHKVEEMHFVSSEAFRSPMAGNVAAFYNADSAKIYLGKFNGKDISWKEMQSHD